MKKSFVLSFVVLLILGILAGCGGAPASNESSPPASAPPSAPVSSTPTAGTVSGGPIANAGYDGTVYKIACDAAYAPFSIQLGEGDTAPGTVVTAANGMGDYYGIDVEILDAVAKYEGFQYELTPMDFSGIIPALTSGTIHGSIAGMNITEERKQSVDFSDGYYESGSALIVNKDDTSVSSFDDLKGKVAACKEGTTGMNWCQDNADKYGFTVSVYPDSASMMLAVSNKQADFMIEDYPVISYQIAIGEQGALKVSIDAIEEAPQNGFAVKKGENATLLAMFNEGLAAIRADGTYDKIVNSYK
jgi:glutamine transport system substrate-binding protein